MFLVPPLETHVLSQNSWQRGGPVLLRVIVLNHRIGKAVPAHARLTLAGPKKAAYVLRAGWTDNAGTADASFKAPRAALGA